MENSSLSTSRLIVYGHAYCGLAAWLQRTLDENGIDYEWRDVRTGEARFKDELKALARGYLSVPTVIFPDGTVMVEPRPEMVLKKLDADKVERKDRT